MEENRDKGEIKKTKGEEDVAKKKRGRKKGFVLVIHVVRGMGLNNFFFFFFSKLMKKKIILEKCYL